MIQRYNFHKHVVGGLLNPHLLLAPPLLARKITTAAHSYCKLVFVICKVISLLM